MTIAQSLRQVRSKVAGFSLAMLVMSMFTVGVAQAATFNDVPADHWAYPFVEKLAADGVLNTSTGTYRPADPANRAEMAKLVVEAFDLPLENPDVATFKDVPKMMADGSSNWAYTYIETAAKHAIVGGYKDETGMLTGYYGPSDPVTREQAMKMLVLGAPLTTNTKGGPHFTDVPASRWSYEMVETGYNWMVVDGYPGTTLFKPENNINRAEIAKMVANSMDPQQRPGSGFSLDMADATSATMVDVCFTEEPTSTEAMDETNYMIEDLNGTELAVTAVSAGTDPMCVELTTAAQDSTKVYELTVTGLTSADSGEVIMAGSVQFNGYTVGTTGALTVRVDGSTPDGMDIPKNGANILFSVFAFEASDDEDLNVEELIVTREGLGLPADFDSVKLYVDGVQKGSEKTVNTSTNSATFSLTGDPIVVPAGTTVLVELRGDMSGAENSQNALCINTSDDVMAFGDTTGTEVTVGGDFAACGEHMTTTSAEVGTITYEVDDYTGDVNVGDTNVSVARLKLDVSSKEDVNVTRVSFKQKGSADVEDFANAMLYLSGTPVDAEGVWEGDFLTFDLTEAPVFIERGNSRTLELRVDVVGGLGNDLSFDIYRDWHIEGVGEVYHYGVNVEEVVVPPALATRDIIGGNLALSLSAGNPTVGDVAAGAEDQPFMAFNLSTGGDGIEVLGFDLDINYGGLWGAEDELQDVKVWTKNASGTLVVVAGPLDPAAGCGNPCTLQFNDSFTQNAGLTKEYIVTADVDNNAPDGAEYDFELDSATLDAEYLSNGDAVAAGDISGGILSGKIQTVADPQLDVTRSVLPADQNIVGGKTDLDVAAWNFEASSASDIKVTSVTITCDYNDVIADGDVCSDVWSSGRLYYVDGSTYTLLQGNKSFTGGTVVFNTINHVVPAGDTHKLLLRANTSTAADGTDETDFRIDADTDFTAEDEQFNTLDVGQKSTDGFDRNVVFVGAGELTVALSGSSPTDDALVGGAMNKNATIIRLNADQNEDIIVKKLRLHNYGNDRAIAAVKLYDGVTLLGSSIFSSNEASFTNLNVTVPADGQKQLTVVVDTNLVGTAGSGLAESGDLAEIGIDDVNSAFTFESFNNDIKAVGVSSGADVTLVDSVTTANPGDFTVYNTLPKLERTATSPTSGGGTNVPMLEFKVSVEGKAGQTGTIEYLEVAFDGTCTAPPTEFKLYRGNTEIGDSAGDLFMPAGDFTNGIGEEIETGMNSTLKIHADTTGCAVDETLVATVTAFDYNDGKAVYSAMDSNNYLFFDSVPFPMAGHQFKF